MSLTPDEETVLKAYRDIKREKRNGRTRIIIDSSQGGIRNIMAEVGKPRVVYNGKK